MVRFTSNRAIFTPLDFKKFTLSLFYNERHEKYNETLELMNERVCTSLKKSIFIIQKLRILRKSNLNTFDFFIS